MAFLCVFAEFCAFAVFKCNSDTTAMSLPCPKRVLHVIINGYV